MNFREADIESLKRRIGASRKAQSIYSLSKNTLDENTALWHDNHTDAAVIKKSLLRGLKFICYNKKSEMDALKEITKGGSNDDLIADLESLASMAERYLEELIQIKIDESVITQAKIFAEGLGDIWRKSQVIKKDNSETKLMRDKVVTHLRNLEFEVHRWAHFIYADNPAKLKLFTSDYNRSRNKNHRGTDESNTTQISIRTMK